jgi:predicted CoA-substrate-specific enzyme activase
MAYSLGVDIGSINAKLILTSGDCAIVWSGSQRITSNPAATVNNLVSQLGEQFKLDSITSVGVSGSGKSVIPKTLNWVEYSSPLAIVAGLLHCHPKAKTIIQIGGESSFIIELVDGLNKPWQVASNPLCAAGTGHFLEQQAYRLGIGIDELAQLALRCRGDPPRIAARCSVFAKTDIIHLQQKGTPVEVILYSLCQSIARMMTSLKKGPFDEPVYFIGGASANGALLKAIVKEASARNGHPVKVNVPDNYLYIEALGSALLSKGTSSMVTNLPETNGNKHIFTMPPLEKVSFDESAPVYRIVTVATGYLGVDVGSTSTKAVIIDSRGHVMAKNYLMTAGRPIEAVKEVFRNLLQNGSGQVKIRGVGVTGSGRYLIGGFIGADLIRDEITAQARAAAEIDAEADIIEIGGQDSKLILKRNGIVSDYRMNKACAAGTGSFIDELAEMLGVSAKNGGFAKLAFTAPYTIDLGSRCTVFTAQAVASAQQSGKPLEVITASLAGSIARNYLSKVVANCKLGDKVILTGAVFYNQAIISAFQQQLAGKEMIVARQREVSGAIGAALLVRDAGGGSNFHGFQEVIDSHYQLNNFTCQSCENSCTVTRMDIEGKASYYGSRCDRFNSSSSEARKKTLFDKREELLLRGYQQLNGTAPTVGIPRALLVYDYAPLLIEFLNALGVRVSLSGQTTAQIVEQAIQLSYSDSCLPLKLLHGHVAELGQVDYILYPCALRLGKREGDENQKYACPLIQASPFIIHQALNLRERLLVPIIDLSNGTAGTVKSLTGIAVKLGFGRNLGRRAALSGIEAQQRFETDIAMQGKKLMAELHNSDKPGVVLFARSYMSQDAGANLGIAETLTRLGVVPIPLDLLPLNTIDIKKYSDRPYWFYEGRFIAGAAIVAQNPQLYGLVVSNFGCGPNSFMVKIVEDIMLNKPLGHLEIDEHAAEAGIITRLEAFVSTIKAFTTPDGVTKKQRQYFHRGVSPSNGNHKTLIAPMMAPHIDVVAAAMNAFGSRVVVLPEPDQQSLQYANRVTSGAECLPYRITLGDFIKFCDGNGTSLKNIEGLTGGAYGPCRFGKYAIEQTRVLKKIGYNLPIRTTLSNNAYNDLNLGSGFERLAWNGIVTTDCLERLLWRSRPYQKTPGSADRLFIYYKQILIDRFSRKEKITDVIGQATDDFRSLIDPSLPRKPLIGINGEIFLRSNRFSNDDLVRVCEQAGLEVVVSPLGEWFHYTSHRLIEDALQNRQIRKLIFGQIRKLIQEHDSRILTRQCHSLLDNHEPSTAEILALASSYLSPLCGGEAILSIGSGLGWMKCPNIAGVISVMPHGCMPGGVVAAMSDKFGAMYQKPWISLTYDGFAETNNLTRINNLAEIIKFFNRDSQRQNLWA